MAMLFEILTGGCRFIKKCDLYKPSSVTCNKEAGPYCGKHREFVSQESKGSAT